MTRNVSRRDFLKLGGVAVGAGLARPLAFLTARQPAWKLLAPVGRVARRSLTVYAEPDSASPKVRKLTRDELFPLGEVVFADRKRVEAPHENRRWYRLEDGYINSASIQPIEAPHENEILGFIPTCGRLAEVTVPYTQTFYKTLRGTLRRMYRLYYRSVHWLTGTATSPEGKPWYRLTDEWLRVHLYAPAEAFRTIEPAEMAPLHPEVPPEEKRIEVSLGKQLLTAFEGEIVVLQTRVSTGVRYMETPAGEFQVERKHPSKHMGDGGLTPEINAYELPGVPWTTFFHPAGIAFHGAYWHDNFGQPMSQGCVNMRPAEAAWLFRWCDPVFPAEIKERSQWKLVGKGTKVRVY